MKQLIDAAKIKEIIDIIESRRQKHIDRFTEYRYVYSSVNIDDIIRHATTTKELEQIIAEIKNITPPVSDFEPIYNAVVTLGGLDGANIAGKYIDAIKTIADYLEINLDKENAENNEE